MILGKSQGMWMLEFLGSFPGGKCTDSIGPPTSWFKHCLVLRLRLAIELDSLPVTKRDCQVATHTCDHSKCIIYTQNLEMNQNLQWKLYKQNKTKQNINISKPKICVLSFLRGKKSSYC